MVERIILPALAYGSQIFCTLLFTYVISICVCYVRHRTLHIGGHTFLTRFFLPSLALWCALSLFLCYHPIVLSDARTREYYSAQELRQYAQSRAGFYSVHIPIYPVVAEMHSADGEDLFITMHYLYAGTVTWVYGSDAPSIVDPLS